MHYSIGPYHYKLRVPVTECHDSCQITEYKDLYFTKEEIKWLRKQIKSLKI